jgi:hypothetical protein
MKNSANKTNQDVAVWRANVYFVLLHCTENNIRQPLYELEGEASAALLVCSTG